jgi:hypothetical protein
MTGNGEQDTTPVTNEFNQAALTPPGTAVNSTLGGVTVHGFTVTPGQYTSVQLSGTVTFDALGTVDYAFQLDEFTSTGTFINNPFHTVTAVAGSTVAFSFSLDIPSNAGRLAMLVGQTNETHPATVDVTATWICAGGSGGGTATPCVTDPAVSQILEYIWQEVQAIYASIPQPLNSYAEDTVHSGLSGAGSFLIGASTIAVKVDLTTVSNAVGELTGDPNVLFDAGYVTPILAEAPMAGSRIVYASQLVPLPRLTESVGYTLGPGVVATFTELVPGP